MVLMMNNRLGVAKCCNVNIDCNYCKIIQINSNRCIKNIIHKQSKWFKYEPLLNTLTLSTHVAALFTLPLQHSPLDTLARACSRLLNITQHYSKRAWSKWHQWTPIQHLIVLHILTTLSNYLRTIYRSMGNYQYLNKKCYNSNTLITDKESSAQILPCKHLNGRLTTEK